VATTGLVVTEDELRLILASPTETDTLDFKLKIGWASTKSKLDLASDIACFANRSGGLIVFGVEDPRGGPLKPVGLADDDILPDATELGTFVSKFFDPPPKFACRELVLDGLRYAVVKIDEFGVTPIVCKATGNDENKVLVIRAGDFFRRTDAMQCSRIDTANALQDLIASAVAKSGAAVQRMIPADRSRERSPSADRPLPVSSEVETMRICNLSPVGAVRDRSFPEIIELISKGSVYTYGGVVIPRSIDPRSIPPSAIVREPGRLMIERTREENLGRATSIIEVTRDLGVRLREGLWEPDGVMDFSSLISFVLGSLLFAKRFYEGSEVHAMDLEIGLTKPIGRRLVDDMPLTSGFKQAYVATSGLDISITRKVTLDQLQDPALRVAIGREIVAELVGYFGFTLNDGAWDAHLKYVSSNVQGLAA